MNPQAEHPSEPGRQDRVSPSPQTWACRNGACQSADDPTEAGLTPAVQCVVPKGADDPNQSGPSLPDRIPRDRIRSGSIPRGPMFPD